MANRPYIVGDLVHIRTPSEEAIVKVCKVLIRRKNLDPDGYEVVLLFHRKVKNGKPIDQLSDLETGIRIDLSYNFLSKFSEISTDEWWEILYKE